VKATSQISASYSKNSFWPLRLARSPQAALSFDWEVAYSRQECGTPETKTLRSVQIRAFYQLESVQDRRNLSLPASAVPRSLYSLMLTGAGFRRVDIARYQYCMPYPTLFCLDFTSFGVMLTPVWSCDRERKYKPCGGLTAARSATISGLRLSCRIMQSRLGSRKKTGR